MYSKKMNGTAGTILRVLFVLCLLSGFFRMPVYAQKQAPSELSVFLNGEKMEFDVAPTIIGGKTYIPVRKIFEEFGMTVKWNEAKRTVDAFGKNMHIRMKLGNTGILINGVRFEMEAPPLSLSGRTMIPLRAVSQALGVDVQWDGATRSIDLTGEPILHPQAGSYFDGKKIRTNLWDEDYLILTVNGDQLTVEAKCSESLNKSDRVTFYYENADRLTRESFTQSDSTSTYEEFKARVYREAYTGKPVISTFQLKDSPYHVVNTAKAKKVGEGSYDGTYERYYDYFIEKKGEEYVFAVPEHYDANLDLMLNLETPDKYTKLRIYNKSDVLAVVNLSNELCRGASTDLEKIRRIHDWIVENIYYDKDGLYGRKGVCYGSAEVIRTKMTVCEGFANLFRDLLNAQKIPCVKISGDTRHNIFESFDGKTDHAWNLVYADGRWMHFDVTWDTYKEFINGEFEEDDVTYKYYDIDPFFFSYDHRMMKIK